MKKTLLLLAVLMSFASIAYAGVLMSSWTDATKRYCKYSDGQVIVLDYNELCPSYN